MRPEVGVHPAFTVRPYPRGRKGTQIKRDMRLLIVEDEKPLADIVRDSLAEHGFEAVCAYSADDAWEALWKRPFDLVVLDIMLPEGAEAGFRWAEQMR